MEITSLVKAKKFIESKGGIFDDLSLRLKDAEIEILRSRWNVYIIIRKEGKELKLVASADSYYTEHNGIWFSSYEEYDRRAGEV
jgi:hypothetical protein